MATEKIDSGKGTTSSTARPASSLLTNNTPEHTFRSTQDHIAHSPLELFQWLVGIHTPPCLNHPSVADQNFIARFWFWLWRIKPAASTKNYNVGLYQRSKDQERRSRIAYLLTSYISNTLFLLQIMLAAAFTGLSAYKEANAVTLTILGAVNTVVAGCLAWQKGQGVPQRYRKAQDQYQALILEIEMSERAFIDLENGTSTVKLNPHDETTRLLKVYDIARADQQANYPDLYVSTGATAAKLQGELLARVEELAKKLEEKIDGRVEGVVKDVLKT